jgi:hypothetical protein
MDMSRPEVDTARLGRRVGRVREKKLRVGEVREAAAVEPRQQ